MLGVIRSKAMRIRAWLRGDDEGVATAEFAVVMPVVVIMAALLLYAARACVVQLECQDAASNVARELIINESADTQVIAQASTGSSIHVQLSTIGNRIEVTTTCTVLADPLDVLPGTVRGHALGIRQESA